ncbi:RNA methyltransferase [Desulfosarcina ovata]|uniref:tRNA (guanine-N(1)-)-methyltransferase C-terminal domain-containing protein n=1 Tax=Desulfosarcina ovata subsp. ovata TaxID=2752305 RepID=A0A5K8A9M2_9BACT|nr:RNA methyltransferase [Desulfosarcina ovata]BBO89201.1 hypothetical protein DSCOOX_23810 [Desulfosarcina ovata subsp. ovata]
MTDCLGSRLYVALVHYPVIDKNGATIASAVTNLDLHDIARACRTYGVAGYFVITPLEDQMVLVQRILDHWTIGAGGTYNPKRRQALELVRVRATFDAAVDQISGAHGQRPCVVATTARRDSGNLSCHGLREMLAGSAVPVLLALGTAWGLCGSFIDAADYVLEPLKGTCEYNHLSVRSAAAIILDRLLGE